MHDRRGAGPAPDVRHDRVGAPLRAGGRRSVRRHSVSRPGVRVAEPLHSDQPSVALLAAILRLRPHRVARVFTLQPFLFVEPHGGRGSDFGKRRGINRLRQRGLRLRSRHRPHGPWRLGQSRVAVEQFGAVRKLLAAGHKRPAECASSKQSGGTIHVQSLSAIDGSKWRATPGGNTAR